jgi:hypothetical protein
MKFTTIEVMVPLVALVASLAACGGGDDAEAGAPTALNIQPSTLTVTAAAGSASGVCGAGSVGEVFIYGGAAPYRLDNTAPDLVELDRSKVDTRGGSFKVAYLGGCFEPVLVVILDKLNKQVVLTLNNKPAD